ncbi:UDP-N-acetylmuramoyl-tripeptide--D-alanyl-D-alanine ligase [Thermaurantimonas aggregans]|uniref:UDP-N-acetylmuramoyl-tripeptide--D-alanyl-D-alanine ligase n=1 Tax=Thermaurantimonas aggregans TaxID=2173829 RepID=A0A401XJT2_9FLAO|nr:UDP-N-acetylmuramoyl-tripeptide--D-alanyl-D-alanine ligase [Thermaurantimonas aggregans]MCX8148932.1 UDP-N-acetylmuramoyl-tripeptide--D-alanyl-D-alanine ligase [Thermaurantimonas aggregans]GCD77253.1 UDP-N-acetylmuramoyl-tripeptide--D-alanyl-D-alanine ligase [Thermaurantimonas aggregans]
MNRVEDIYKAYLQCDSVSFDSRKLSGKSLFVALKGTKTDGNAFVKQALDTGALYAIADDPTLEGTDRVFVVDDALTALQDLARHHRRQLTIPVIGLTGSNGKTTSKELFRSVFATRYNAYATRGNYNNHIGVPVSVLEIKPDHQIAVIEMGANHQKEIEFLCTISMPDYVYITNYGLAHLEGFGGVEGIIKGKSEIYEYARQNGKTALVNIDDAKQVEKSVGISRIITFGTSDRADYQITLNATKPFVSVKFRDHIIESRLSGGYNFSNIAAAIALGAHFGLSIDEIAQGIAAYTPDNNRSQLVNTRKARIICDAYNANPSSMEGAVSNLAEFDGVRVAILGDMYELGDYTDEAHQYIADLCEKLRIEEVYLIGEYFGRVKTDKWKKLSTTEEAVEFFKSYDPNDKTILVKASRSMALERLYPILGIEA